MSFIIKTKRCLLRAFNADDAPYLYELNNDYEVIKYTGDGPFKSLKAAEDFIIAYDHYQRFGMGRWSCILEKDNSFIGWCGLKYNTDIKMVDIGFRFLRKYWNQGLAYECAQACIHYGFNSLNLDEIIARAITENVNSIKLIQKLGMEFEKNIHLDGQKAQLFKLKNNN